MSTTENLLDWARGLSALAGMHDATYVELGLPDGAVARFVPGEGLTYMVSGLKPFRVPVSALEDERWYVTRESKEKPA